MQHTHWTVRIAKKGSFGMVDFFVSERRKRDMAENDSGSGRRQREERGQESGGAVERQWGLWE